MTKFNIIFLFLIVAPFRFYNVSQELVNITNFRQAQTATIALNFYKQGINLFRTELDIFGIGLERYLTLEFPLYEAIVSLLYRFFFVSDMWGRVVSVIAGYIGAWYLYRLVIELTNHKKIAFFSTFFFLFVPLSMFYQRSFMIDPFVIAQLLGGIYYLCLWVDKGGKKNYLLALLLLTAGFTHKGLWSLLAFASYGLRFKQKIFT